MRRGISHGDEQKNSERDVEAKHHRIARIRRSRMKQRTENQGNQNGELTLQGCFHE
jgi:hypothetical protein